MKSPIGLLLCGHGARNPQAQIPFMAWGEQLLRATGFPDGEIGFMEFADPTIPDAAQRLLAKGYRHLLVIPAFVMGARHAREDIPAILRELQQQPAFTDVRLDYIPGIAGHPQLLAALSARLDEALMHQPPAEHSELLLVAHGSSDEDANAAVQDLAERLGSTRHFRRARAAFCAVCEPRIEQVLAQLPSTTQQAVILPFFILPSAPVQQVYALADEHAARTPSTKITKGNCLADHPLLFEAFRDVIRQKQQEAA